MWPPLGIQAVNPFELPLLNTVYRVIILVDNVAVLVKTQLYELNLTLNYYFMDFPMLLSLPLSVTRFSRVGLPYSEKRYNKLVAKNYLNSAYLDKFYRWFVGFSDAEGNFGISSLLSSKTNKIEGFSFKFKILNLIGVQGGLFNKKGMLVRRLHTNTSSKNTSFDKYLEGFTDAEGCFIISISKVSYFFLYFLHVKNKIIHVIKKYKKKLEN